MSQMGQKQKYRRFKFISALPQRTDIAALPWHV